MSLSEIEQAFELLDHISPSQVAWMRTAPYRNRQTPAGGIGGSGDGGDDGWKMVPLFRAVLIILRYTSDEFLEYQMQC